MNNNSFWAAA